MTWTETHQRTRIIREVEAAAAADMSGAVPWREEWAPYFDGPSGLVAVLRARWNRTCEAQLDAQAGEDQLHDAYDRLRRTQAAVLAILRRADTDAVEVLVLAGPRPVAAPGRTRRSLLRGPVLPV